MAETFAVGFWCLENHTQLIGQQKVANLSCKCRKLDHNCVIIRAFLCNYQSKFVNIPFYPRKICCE